MMKRAWCVCVVGLLVGGPVLGQATSPPPGPPAEAKPVKAKGVELIQQQAAGLKGMATTEPAWRFLQAAGDLPRVEPREMLRDPKTKVIYSPESAAELPEAERGALQPVTLDENFYYTTKYGSPLAFVRPLEILGKHGFGDPAGKRLLDFGYGSIGNLQLLALAGVDAVGVDVDPLLKELYSRSGDQGPVKGPRAEGKVTLVHGQWPAEEGARAAVGGGYDVIVSKNTLKNGYIHPERPVDKRMLVDLGVADAEYVKALYEALKPGGWVLIYNLCPAPAPPDKPYIPWADGRCPFPQEMWEGAGFKVVEFDVNEDGPARELGRALGWDKDGMDLEKGLFAWYTLVQKPAGG